VQSFFQAEPAADAGAQPVARDEMRRTKRIHAYFRRILVDDLHAMIEDRDAELRCPRAERTMQLRTSYAPAAAASKTSVRVDAVLDVPDAGKREMALDLDARALERLDRGRHEAFAAGFVDRRRPRFEHGDVDSARSGFDGREKSDGAGASNQQIVTACRVLSAGDGRIVTVGHVSLFAPKWLLT
jgi:hypothetical protein